MSVRAERDDRLDRIIHRILQIGVAASSLCLAFGLVWTFAAPASASAGTLITVGLLILLGTPVARVVASVIEYAVERDWLCVTLTSVVLLDIIASVIAALVFDQKL